MRVPVNKKSKSYLTDRAFRARDAYEYAFQNGYPTAYVNKRERDYTKALQALTDNGYHDARDFVAHFYDVAPKEIDGTDGQREAVAM